MQLREWNTDVGVSVHRLESTPLGHSLTHPLSHSPTLTQTHTHSLSLSLTHFTYSNMMPGLSATPGMAFL